MPMNPYLYNDPDDNGGAFEAPGPPFPSASPPWQPGLSAWFQPIWGAPGNPPAPYADLLLRYLLTQMRDGVTVEPLPDARPTIPRTDIPDSGRSEDAPPSRWLQPDENVDMRIWRMPDRYIDRAMEFLIPQNFWPGMIRRDLGST